MNTQIGQTARLPFPQISLQRALEETLKVYAASSDARLLSEQKFGQLLGREMTSGTLLRLTSTLRQYGLVAANRHSPALTSLAQELYSTDDRPRFFSLLLAAANCPGLAQELPYDDAAELQPEKIERRLIALSLDSRSRRAIMSVLLENESFLIAEKASGTLFHRIQALRESQPRPGVSTDASGAKGRLKVMSGRAASLMLVALFVTGSLIYAMPHLVRLGSMANTHPIPSAVTEVGVQTRSSTPVTVAPPELRALTNDQTNNQASQSTLPEASPRSVDDGNMTPVQPPAAAVLEMAQQRWDRYLVYLAGNVQADRTLQDVEDKRIKAEGKKLARDTDDQGHIIEADFHITNRHQIINLFGARSTEDKQFVDIGVHVSTLPLAERIKYYQRLNYNVCLFGVEDASRFKTGLSNLINNIHHGAAIGDKQNEQTADGLWGDTYGFKLTSTEYAHSRAIMQAVEGGWPGWLVGQYIKSESWADSVWANSW